MAKTAYSLWRRRWRRYARRYWSKRYRRIENARKYKTKQRLEYVDAIIIGANAQAVQMQVNMSQMLVAMQGWQQFSEMYSNFRISFVKVRIHVSMEATVANKRQEVYIGWFPGEKDNMKTINQIIANQAQGYGSYGNDKNKTLLWRSTASKSGIQGYGSAMPIAQVDNIMGMFFIRNAMANYIAQVLQVPTIIGSMVFTVYVEFYDNLI